MPAHSSGRNLIYAWQDPPEHPVFKTQVTDLVIKDWVLVEDEFGEYLTYQVERFGNYGKTIYISGLVFNLEDGNEVGRSETKAAIVGRIAGDKRIHLGNGVLFTEQERDLSWKRRSRMRDRKKLIDQILRASPSDWSLFEDNELIELVRRLFRLNNVELKIISKEPNVTEYKDFIISN